MLNLYLILSLSSYPESGAGGMNMGVMRRLPSDVRVSICLLIGPFIGVRCVTGCSVAGSVWFAGTTGSFISACFSRTSSNSGVSTTQVWRADGDRNFPYIRSCNVLYMKESQIKVVWI